MRCPRCQTRARRGQNFCARCGLSLRATGGLGQLAPFDAPEVVIPGPDGPDGPDGPAPAADPGFAAGAPPAPRPVASKRGGWASSPAAVRFSGQLIASAISGVVTALLALVFAFYFFGNRPGPGGNMPYQINILTPIPFEERNEGEIINASGIVPIADSRFLVVDDRTDDAFFELALTPEGKKAGPLVRRQIAGLTPGEVEDLEDSAYLEHDGKRFIVAVSSLEKHEGESTDAGLIRVTIGEGGALGGEPMPGFRDWLIASYPELSDAPGGPEYLDVQGIVWDPARDALLLGVRSETRTGEPLVVPVRVKNWSGAWSTDNLERMRSVTLRLGDASGAKGIRGIARRPDRNEFVVIVGAAVGHRPPFRLYAWDGNDAGTVSEIPNVLFDPTTRPEGITYGTVGGKAAAIVVDDNGGYYVIWE